MSYALISAINEVNRMSSEKINLKEKLSKFSDHWSPKVIAEMNDYQFKLVKIKGDFETNFPESTDSKWGFLKGREIAIIRYPTVELALTLGKTAAEEQTELIEVVEKNIAHGPKVERKECRGHTGQGIHGNCASRREPMYTEYIIYGNLVLMIEPLATEEPIDTLEFLKQISTKLP